MSVCVCVCVCACVRACVCHRNEDSKIDIEEFERETLYCKSNEKNC
jgi:hypothetical protein